MKTMDEEKSLLNELLKGLKKIQVSPKFVNSPKPSGDYALTPQALEHWAFDLVEAEKQLAHCKDCQGQCPLDPQGFTPVIGIANDEVHISYKLCAFEQQRRQKARQAQLLKTAHVPKRYATVSRADYQRQKGDDTLIDVAKRCIAGASTRGALFYGARGTGKTMLAAIIANERLKQGLPALFYSAPNLFGDIRDAIRSGKTEEVVRSVMNAPFLILDDLGAERMTGWVGERLYMIINHRYNEELPTLITSNLGPIELAEHMVARDTQGNIIEEMQGERIVSRIVGMCDVVYFGGQDWREQKALHELRREDS